MELKFVSNQKPGKVDVTTLPCIHTSIALERIKTHSRAD